MSIETRLRSSCGKDHSENAAMTHTTDSRESAGCALMVLCLGVLMIVLDTTIVNVALPSIRADLGFTETSLVWVVNAYMLTFGGFLLLGGRLGDLYGHRRLFLLGIALFTLASLACGLAQLAGAADRRARGAGPGRRGGLGGRAVADHESVHRAGRARQGDGRLRLRLRRRRQRRRAARRPADRARSSWHWIFLVNLPIGVAVYALCSRCCSAGRGAGATRAARRRRRGHRHRCR